MVLKPCFCIFLAFCALLACAFSLFVATGLLDTLPVEQPVAIKEIANTTTQKNKLKNQASISINLA
jgi:hypothetical protein